MLSRLSISVLVLILGWPLVAWNPPTAALEPSGTYDVPAETEFPVRGVCIDTNGDPLNGVDIRLYHRQDAERGFELVRVVQTGGTGEFDLGNLPIDIVSAVESRKGFIAFAQKPGFGTIELPLNSFRMNISKQPIEVTLPEAETLRGTLRSIDGSPIVGAQIFASEEPLPGLRTATTDEHGHFAIPDLPRFNAEMVRDRGVLVPVSRMVLRVSHPDWGRSAIWYWSTKQQLQIELSPPATLRGRVVDSKGVGIANLKLCAQPIGDSSPNAAPPDSTFFSTNERGEYNVRLQGNQSVNLLLFESEFVAEAIENVRLVEDTATDLPDIRATNGTVIYGEVIDDDTNRPIALEPGDEIWIMAHSMGRPRSSGAVHGVRVGKDGRYSMRVPEGTCWPYFGGGTTAAGIPWMVMGGPVAEGGRLKTYDAEGREGVHVPFRVARP